MKLDVLPLSCLNKPLAVVEANPYVVLVGTTHVPSPRRKDVCLPAAGAGTNADKKTMNRLIGVNTVTTLANLPISKRSITATLSAATTLSVQSGMQIGEELMIRCVPSAAFTQAIPNSGAYVSMSGTSITTTANKPFEINIWCYASGKYSIAVKEQD